MIKQKYGNLKILWHQDKLKALLEDKVTAPIYVRIKPTNKCNHRCFYCSYDPKFKNILSQTMNRNDQIPKNKMMEILDDFKDIGVKAVTYSGGGEPLVYPAIVDTLRKTLENGIDLSIITNGQKLNDERAELLYGAKWVRISQDSARAETFKKIRKVPERLFEELKDNIEKFSKNKNKDCELGINYVIQEYNADQVYDAAKLYHDLGVNHIKFTPMWVERGFHEYHGRFVDTVIDQIERAKTELTDENFAVYDTYENDFKLTGVSERKYTRCAIMQTVPSIGADCVVYFCHDKTYTKKGGSLGSIKDQSFKDLWFSEESANKFKTFNPQEECKHHCTFDARNILIKDTIDCYGNHINFI